jgi:hypothetical protein
MQGHRGDQGSRGAAAGERAGASGRLARGGAWVALALVAAIAAAPAGAQTCGDCNMDGQLSILDALLGAQIGAGLVAPTPAHLPVCDVDTSGAIDVLDALRMAQAAAGLPVTLSCAPIVVPVACSIVFPASGSYGNDIPIGFDLTGGPDVVDLVFEFSSNGGASWSPATAAAGSPAPCATNPAPAVSAPDDHLFFLWASLSDLGPVGVAVDFRVRIAAAGGAVCTTSFLASTGPGSPPFPPVAGTLAISEIHANPAMGLDGDANEDGVRDAEDDEFVEIVNISSFMVAIGGVTISDSIGVRHTFPGGVMLLPGQCIVVFGGGTPAGAFGASQVEVASSGMLALNDAGDTVTLGFGGPVDAYTYGPEGGMEQALVAVPEPSSGSVGGRPLQLHTTTPAGARFSPGTQADTWTPRW